MQYKIKVDELRTFSEGTRKRYFATVPVVHLLDPTPPLPLDVNARAQNLRLGVARAIRRSLEDPEKAEIFHLLNRGMVIAAKAVAFDTSSRLLTLELTDSALHGVLDGGHTYKVIREYAPEDSPARVTLEILTGSEDYQADIVEARNTSTQVVEYALANVRKEFEPILEWLDQRGIPRNRIRVKQFDPSADIPILDVLAIMYLFDIETFGTDVDGLDNPPILAYSGKGSVLKHFSVEKKTPIFTKKLLPLLPDILWLWDYVAFRLLDHYREGLGNPTGRVGSRRGNTVASKQGDFMTDMEIVHIPHRAYRLPVMAAMRCLVEHQGDAFGWRELPHGTPEVPSEIQQKLGRPATRVERFYELVAPKLWQQLMTEAANSTPNKIGKSPMVWNRLYATAWRFTQGG